ncbi:uncharacterized protein LOC124444592 [Xenia sp. Carnegie-2017]|uniref:uncharacterized protein LOC124444592 n=1 Tax=Xenia sp. Carnegie-2017 TaxID=2897299 RepID=UPI001F04A5FC|nr:uncharacterized protein LOC124444592 [Xenia sp. Carnegie-2017]
MFNCIEINPFCVVGSPGLREDLLDVASHIVCKYIENDLGSSTTSSANNENALKSKRVRTDLIDPEAFDEIRRGKWSCEELRNLVLNMVLPSSAFSGSKGGNKWPVARIKNFWSKAEQPSFWPLHIPFCSPSARKEIPLDGNNDKKIFRKVLNKAELTEIVLSYWNYITDFNEENIEEEYQDMEKETEIEEINEEKADEFKQEKKHEDIDEEEIQDEDMDYEHNTKKYLKEEGNEEDEMGPEEHFMMQEKTESADLNIKDMYEKVNLSFHMTKVKIYMYQDKQYAINIVILLLWKTFAKCFIRQWIF